MQALIRRLVLFAFIRGWLRATVVVSLLHKLR